MSRATVVLSICAVYLAASLAFGLLPGRRAQRSAQGYVAGDRALGLVLMYFITGATIFSAFAFLGLPGWAYSRGAAAFYILGYGALGMTPLYFVGPRAARVGRAQGFLTQAQMVAARFERPAIAGWMAGVSVIAFVPYLALQMKGAGYVLETMSDGAVPAWAGSLVVYGVVLAYVLKSGVLGVGWTNTFQGLFMMALAWGLGLYLPRQLYGGVPEMFDRILAERPEMLALPGLSSGGGPWPASEYGSAVFVSIVGFSMWPHLFMKAFTARDIRTLKRTVVLYPTFQVFLLPLLFIGFAGVLFDGAPASPDQILPYILLHADIAAPLVGLFCAGALAASMSSGDAMTHAAASILVRDGVVTAGGRALSSSAERRWIQAAVVAVMLGAYLVAVAYQGSLVTLLLTTYGAVVQFAPAVVCALYVPRASGAAVLASLVIGSLVTFFFVLQPDLRPFAVHAGLYGLIANLAVLAPWVAVSAPTDAARRFVATAAGE